MKYFGTDGIRNKLSFFDKSFLRHVAGGISLLPNCKTVVIARDTRIGGIYMESILCNELNKLGINVVKLGIIPSPALSFCLTKLGLDYGIMLSASHNPPEFNGIKLFERCGKKLSRENEMIIENYLENPSPLPLNYGETDFANGKLLYLEFIKERFENSLSGMKILLDCACGAASYFAKDVFISAGAEITTCFDSYCGNKINVRCGAANPSTLLKLCSDYYDIGFAFDGDADRVYACSKGKLYSGDKLMYITAKHMASAHKLNKNSVVGTVMANSGIENAYLKNNINFIRTDVGDRNVYFEMQKNGYNLGGEESGHIIFSDYLKTGDGVLTALIAGNIHKTLPLYISDDVTLIPSFSDCISANNAEMDAFASDARINEVLSATKNVRVIARPSGTEPKIRLTCESQDRNVALNTLSFLKTEITRILNDYKQN